MTWVLHDGIYESLFVATLMDRNPSIWMTPENLWNPLDHINCNCEGLQIGIAIGMVVLRAMLPPEGSLGSSLRRRLFANDAAQWYIRFLSLCFKPVRIQETQWRENFEIFGFLNALDGALWTFLKLSVCHISDKHNSSDATHIERQSIAIAHHS